MTEETKTVDFGAPEAFGAHVFRVEIPLSRAEPIRIIEDYGYTGGENGLPYEEDRATLPRTAWSVISEMARQDFNDRLKIKKVSTGRWKTGKNLIDRLLGKELCVLAWASERAQPEELPIVCSRWGALRPEERWWLFSMTVAEAGLPADKDRGWRKALYYALSDGTPKESPRKRLRPKEKPESSLPLLRFMKANP